MLRGTHRCKFPQHATAEKRTRNMKEMAVWGQMAWWQARGEGEGGGQEEEAAALRTRRMLSQIFFR
jgi:hypothetical protein